MANIVKCLISTYCRKILHSPSKILYIKHNLMTTETLSTKTKPTAGIIIIGDEIIKGQVQDSNSNYLCKKLHKLGVRVERISVIRDDVDVIANEIKLFSHNFQYVLTSGGIGPTHDDVTYEGIAKAFNEKLHIDPQLEQLLKQFFPDLNPNSAAIRLAQVPESARILFSNAQIKGTPFPIVSVKNIFIFPGVPQLLVKLFDGVGEELFSQPDFRLHCREVYVTRKEIDITPVLNQAVDIFKNNVVFGSYPELFHSYYKVRFTMEANSDDLLDQAEDFFKKKFPNGVIIDFDNKPTKNSMNKIKDFISKTTNRQLAMRVQDSLDVLNECFDKYEFPSICLSFNGGKDCTALLHLVLAVLEERGRTEPLSCLYIRGPAPFDQLEKFIQESSTRCKLNLFIVTGSVKVALIQTKKSHPEISVCIMGTRRTDPHSADLQPFQNTDADWPKYVRVSPILDWTYNDVWEFIRNLYLPYCDLYDRGYTSIGNMNDTTPNPNLRYTDSKGKIQYRPAYMLTEEDYERNGRPS